MAIKKLDGNNQKRKVPLNSKELLCGNGATAEAIIRTAILQKLLTALGIRWHLSPSELPIVNQIDHDDQHSVRNIPKKE